MAGQAKRRKTNAERRAEEEQKKADREGADPDEPWVLQASRVYYSPALLVCRSFQSSGSLYPCMTSALMASQIDRHQLSTTPMCFVVFTCNAAGMKAVLHATVPKNLASLKTKRFLFHTGVS